MPLREVLASLEVEVRGLGSIDKANALVSRAVDVTSSAATEYERARIKAAEFAEMAARLANRIRRLQKAEGDNSKELEGLRRAHIRASDAAREHAVTASRLRGGTDVAATSGTNLAASFVQVGGAMALAGAAIATVHRTLGGIVDVFSGVIDAGDQVDELAEKLGISSGRLQEWQFIGERTGVSVENLGQAFSRVARLAASGGAELRRLGVDTRGTNGELRSQDEIFQDTVGALASIENPTERAAAAQRVFGRSAADLAGLLAEGGPGLEAMRARFAELGGGLSVDVVKNAKEAKAAFQDFRLVMQVMQGALVANVLPAITRVVTTVSTWVGAFVELTRTSSIVETVLYGLAGVFGVIALALAPVVLPTLALGAALALVFLAVEDVVTAFRGGDSLFGDWVEGMSEAAGFTSTFQGIITELGLAIDLMVIGAEENLASLLDSLNRLAGPVAEALGIDLSAIGAAARSLRQTAVEDRGTFDTRRELADSAEHSRRNEQLRRLDPEWMRRQGERMDAGGVQPWVPAAPEVEARSERRRARGGGRGGGNRVSVNAPITINGATDAEAVGRVVRREMHRAHREAADTLPLSEGA